MTPPAMSVLSYLPDVLIVCSCFSWAVFMSPKSKAKASAKQTVKKNEPVKTKPTDKAAAKNKKADEVVDTEVESEAHASRSDISKTINKLKYTGDPSKNKKGTPQEIEQAQTLLTYYKKIGTTAERHKFINQMEQVGIKGLAKKISVVEDETDLASSFFARNIKFRSAKQIFEAEGLDVNDYDNDTFEKLLGRILTDNAKKYGYEPESNNHQVKELEKFLYVEDHGNTKQDGTSSSSSVNRRQEADVGDEGKLLKDLAKNNIQIKVEYERFCKVQQNLTTIKCGKRKLVNYENSFNDMAAKLNALSKKDDSLLGKKDQAVKAAQTLREYVGGVTGDLLTWEQLEKTDDIPDDVLEQQATLIRGMATYDTTMKELSNDLRRFAK